MPWHIYIIECNDGKLYTGITNNLERRIQEHNGGYGCRFTRIRSPVKLVHSEAALLTYAEVIRLISPTVTVFLLLLRSSIDRAQALKRESRIKHLTRAEKLKLIKGIKNK